MYTVYMYTNIHNGKVYIGRTANSLEYRARNGSNYKGSKLFNAAIQQFGWNSFIPTILKECATRAEANHWEQYYIQQYGSNCLDKGYNIERGGQEGPQAEISRQKISAKAKERYTDPTKNPNYGKHWGKDFKQKMRDKFSGKGGYWYGKHRTEAEKQYYSKLFKGTGKTVRKKPWTAEELATKRRIMKETSKCWSKKVRCIEDDIVFDTITEAAAYVRRNQSTLSEVLHKRIGSSCGGKHFEFVS